MKLKGSESSDDFGMLFIKDTNKDAIDSWRYMVASNGIFATLCLPSQVGPPINKFMLGFRLRVGPDIF